MSSRAHETPKGRINVKFEVDDNGQTREVSLPYRVLYFGDLAGDTPGPAFKEREPIAIDLDNFDEVLRAHRPTLSFQVDDHVSGVAGQKFAIDLKFESMADFSPDRLIERVEALKALKSRRDALAAIRHPLDAGRGDLAERLAALLGDQAARRVLKAHYDSPPTAASIDGDPQ